MRCQPNAIVRLCAVAGLAVVASSVSPALVGLAQSVPPLTPWRGLIDHVSATQMGGVSQTGVEVTGHAISGDGRFVVMNSLATDLVTDDSNWAQDVFLRDRQTGTMTRVSGAANGGDGDGFSELATISTNGRHVAFVSTSTNLIADDTNGMADIFVRDLDAGRTVRVSIASNGTESDGYAYWPVISATGRFVVFVTNATTFVAGPAPYGPTQIYLHDRDADADGTFDEPGATTTTLESVSSSGAMADGYAQHARVSADGRFVLFESPATNLDPVGNPNASNHLYVRDRQSGTTTLVDRSVTGGPSSYGVDYRTADMSDDGRFITYTTYSSDIVFSESTSWNAQVLRYDSQAQGQATSIVTALPDGALGEGYSYDTSVSADGRYVAFRSTATNLAAPAPPANTAGIFVRDMVEGTFTRVDVVSSGEPFDHSYPYYPSISADGTAVAFMSPALNAVDGQYTFGSHHTFVATAFSLSATSASFPMAGGSGTIEVNTLPVTGWNAVSLDEWITVTGGAGFGAGPRTVTFVVAENSSGILRNGRIRIGSTIVAVQQEGDGDATPPVITPIVTGTLSPSGWYTSNITVQWSVTDAESEIVSTGAGCATHTFTSDFMYASPTCEATSHGGTTSVSVPLRRDTTPPSIAINAPLPVFYPTGSTIVPAFGCSDAPNYSGVASCERSGGAGPLDSTTPGWRPFTVTATDQAGNTTSKTIEYLIGTGACVAPTQTLRAWWRFNGTMFDTVAHRFASASYSSGSYVNGVAGQGWSNAAPQNYLMAQDESELSMSNTMTVAMWVNPFGMSGSSGTLITKPAQYRIARYPDGTLRWAFSRTTGYNWVNTGAVIPYNAWSHVALTYDNGWVKAYVNGRFVHSTVLGGNPSSSGDPNASLTIGGRADVLAALMGVYDDVQVYDGVMTPESIAALAQAGSGTLCVPNGSTLTITAPPTIAYGATFRVTAVLRDEAGNPVPNQQVWLNSHVSPSGFWGGVTGTTDAAGETYADLPVSPSAALGAYARAASAVFEGNVVYRESSAQVGATLVAGTPVINWPTPASIVYGTPLGAAQLNASASTAGSFSYSPAAGTALDAGAQTLSVTFTPTDTTHWGPSTKTLTLTVDKAAPVLNATGGTFTYDAQPHGGSGTATGVQGEALSPVGLLYNGTSTSPPTEAGTHTVQATFAGSANYTSGQSAAVPLVIGRAVPTVEISGNNLFYSGQPRQAIVTVRGVGGVELNPVTVSYDGGSALPVNAGIYAVRAEFGGNANYEPVTGDGTLVINKTTPIMSMGAETVTYDGQPHGASAAAVGVHNEFLTPIVITYDGSTSMPVNAGSYVVEARYDGSANYTPLVRTATLTIVKANPYLEWFPGPESVFYGTPLGAAQLRATANVPGTFAYSPAAGTILNVGTHLLTATFTPADQVNFTTRSTTATVSIWKATPSVTWPNPAAIVYGTALSETELNASASVAGTFTYTPAAGTLLNVGTHVLSVNFVPTDAANYNTVNRGAVLTVSRAAPSITWSAPQAIVYGTALGAAQLNASASVPGTFAYSPAAGTVLTAGTHTLTVTFTPTDTANYSPATSTTSITVTPAASTITWSAPQAIVYGTALGAAQLNASASVPGTFAYSPAAGTVLTAGTHTLTVTFTPTDTANYSPATSTTYITVTTAASTITWPAPQAIVYGTALGAAQLNASASVPGTFAYSPAAGTVLTAGTHTLTVTFTPTDTANHTGTSTSRVLTVVRAPLSIAANNTAKPFGAALPPFSATPSGFVNGDSMASLGGTLAFATSANASSPVGAYPVTPQGLSSANYAITFVSGALTVVKADTSIAVASSPVPSGFNQPVTYTAAVSVLAPGAGAPTGTVQFFDGATLVGTSPLVAGSASLTTNGLTAGSHSISATYSGDGSFAASTAATAHTVRPSSTSSTTILTSTRNPANVGQSVTFRATVASPAGGVSGSVAFYDGATLLGTTTIASGVAQFTTTTLPAGGHAIVARYLGNASLPPSVSAALAQTVGSQSRSSSTALAIAPSPSSLGTEVTMTATITGGQQKAPTGDVLFIVNGELVQTVAVTVTGSTTSEAVLTTSGLPRGTHSVVVVYLSDATFRASSRTATVTVN